jgi:hypothetical protein
MGNLIIPGYLVLALLGQPLGAEATPPESQPVQTLEELKEMLAELIAEREALAKNPALEYSLQVPWLGGRFGVDYIPANSPGYHSPSTNVRRIKSARYQENSKHIF